MWASGTRFEGSCTSKILCMDWMASRDGRGGWLATGCSEGTVGVSWISDPESSRDTPVDDEADTAMAGGATAATIAGGNMANTVAEEASYYKSHFILKGHLGEVRVVRWRPLGDRLASYDSWGKVIVWINRAHVLAFEFQITTQLIVADLQWSPCGYYSLLCGKEGQIQLLSGVNGTNFFSVQIESTGVPSLKAEFVCCAWNQPSTRVALGTENGEIIVVNPEEGGNSVSTIALGRKESAVQCLTWFGPLITIRKTSGEKYKSQGLSVYLRNGDILLFKSITCQECLRSKTGVVDGTAVWNTDQTLWAIVGYKKNSSAGSTPIARFVNREGYIIYTLTEGLPMIPRTQSSLRNVIWALHDNTMLLTWGCHLYSMELTSSLPSLQTLCRRVIVDTLISCGKSGVTAVQELPLPKREIEKLTTINTPLITAPFNVCSPHILSDLFQPIPEEQRLHCIMESTEFGYVLKYEYFNQYRALLNARKSKKGGFMMGSYQIEPAFDCSHLEQAIASGSIKKESQNWATLVDSSADDNTLKTPPSCSHHILQQLKTVFRPGHNSGAVTDVVHNRLDTSASAVADQREPSNRVVIAEVEGNFIVNRFRFHTNSPLFEDGYLGALNISTNYVKCKPRKLTVHLNGTTSSGSFDELSLRSKDPDWNDKCQVYELDFGGRVSHDSIKNFQIEKGGQVVMQFGKSDSKRFCLDFQAPFSPVQALCVALTCVL